MIDMFYHLESAFYIFEIELFVFELDVFYSNLVFIILNYDLVFFLN